MSDPLENLLRAVRFIEAHLQAETGVAQMADAAGYSLFHFLRTFSRGVQHTPYNYLMRRRLSEAARALSSSRRRIIDISQDFCFNNHETFCRAFRRMFGMQPGQWRAHRPPDWSLLMPPLTLEDLLFLNRPDFQPPALQELPESAWWGLMTPLEGDEEARGRQRRRAFDDLLHITAGMALDPPAPRLAGISLQAGGSTYYFAGVELPLPAAPVLARLNLPAGAYACMEIPEGSRREALNYLHHTWLPAAGRRPACGPQAEFFSPGGLGCTLALPA